MRCRIQITPGPLCDSLFDVVSSFDSKSKLSVSIYCKRLQHPQRLVTEMFPLERVIGKSISPSHLQSGLPWLTESCVVELLNQI